jgi:D-3-phosphoglycerate dehydrogenase
MIVEKLREPVDLLISHEHQVIATSELHPISKRVLTLIKEVDAILVGSELKLTRDLIFTTKTLKVISLIGAGFDTVDLEAATSQRIIVTNTPGLNAKTVADLTWGLLIAVARQIPQANQTTKLGQWERNLGVDISGKILGVVGSGSIGLEVIKRAKGFEMDILCYTRSPREALAKRFDFEYVPLEALMKHSDFVSLHTALTPETEGMIGEPLLELLKPTAVLINTARAKLVDQRALLKILQNNRIFGAGVDVYDDEPPQTDPLLQCPNVIATPHVGGFTHATIKNTAMRAAQNIVDVLAGRKPNSVLNPSVFETSEHQ